VSLCELLLAQHAVDPMNRYYRLICLVHLTGSGQAADPIVPGMIETERVRTRKYSGAVALDITQRIGSTKAHRAWDRVFAPNLRKIWRNTLV
jgi:hypothetical protein